MARRLALLIGNTTFENTETFPNLHTPANNVQDFAAVLRQHGDFEILDELVDATSETIRWAIDGLFSGAKRGDLTFLYYAGHGHKDRAGRHYLVARDTQPERSISLWNTRDILSRRR